MGDDEPLPPDPFSASGLPGFPHLAAALFDLFTACSGAGFTETQAMHLTAQYMTLLIANAASQQD